MKAARFTIAHSPQRSQASSSARCGRHRSWVTFVILMFTWLELVAHASAAELPWIGVSKDKPHFVHTGTTTQFIPWGFNYDHDVEGRLLEDYWDADWDEVELHFAQMKRLGANVVRIHLQVGKFLVAPDQSNEKSLDRLSKMITLAERTGLYLDVTGLGCYHKQDVPTWYDDLSESERWAAQAFFWKAIARQCANSPAIFCYDLMNEPVVPVGKGKPGAWLGPAFAGKHFVQYISLDQQDRPREEIAKKWIHQLTAAIREVDQRHLITVGLVDWSLDRPGLRSGFVPSVVCDELDFVCVHLYPEKGKLDDAITTLKGFAIGKPLVIEETLPLKCSPQEFDQFLDRSREHATGWIGFYWGKPPEELRQSSSIADAIMLQWLETFERKSPLLSR